MKYKLFDLSRFKLDALLMPRGAHHLEVLEEGDRRVLALAHGQLTVQLQGRSRPMPKLTVTPTTPVFLVSPGSYHVTADKHSAGVRGIRRGG